MIEQNPHRLRGASAGQKFLRYGSIALALSAIALNWFASQRIAALLGYPVNLNGHIVGHLYQPFAWWWWAHRWPSGLLVPVGDAGVPIEAIWKACERLVMYPLLVIGIIGGLIGVLLSHRETPADLHGSASWANTNEIKEAELL